MRLLVVALGLTVSLSLGGCTARSAPQASAKRSTELLAGIKDDVMAIFEAFSGGIDAPNSPVNDPRALGAAQAHLDAARQKAERLAAEMDAQTGSKDGR
jgi:hypothetical protein